MDVKDFLEKISSYNIFNNLFPGVIFVVIAREFTSYNFIQDDILTGIFLYYFIGIVISRIGSILIEPLLKDIKFVIFAPYKNYLDACKNDSKIEILSEVNNTYRTLVAMSILLLLLKAFKETKIKFLINDNYDLYLILSLMFFMFLLAYKKQTAYIRKRVEQKY